MFKANKVCNKILNYKKEKIMENLDLQIKKLNGNIESLGMTVSGLRKNIDEHKKAVSSEEPFLKENTETLKKNNRL